MYSISLSNQVSDMGSLEEGPGQEPIPWMLNKNSILKVTMHSWSASFVFLKFPRYCVIYLFVAKSLKAKQRAQIAFGLGVYLQRLCTTIFPAAKVRTGQ